MTTFFPKDHKPLKPPVGRGLYKVKMQARKKGSRSFMRTFAVLLFAILMISAGQAGNALAGEVLIRDRELAQTEVVPPLPADSFAQAMDFEEDNDPLEGLNRGIFEFNRVVDGVLIKPLAQIYRGVLPQQAQDSVRSFLRNLRTPAILVNDVLQGDMDRAGTTISRFLVNTTLGIAGLFDVATELGIPFHDEDFGQTLAVWGIGEGPYLVLPILGPSNPRDAVGLASEWFLDPVNIYARNEDQDWVPWVRGGLTGIDARARSIDVLEELERTSLDYYAAIRSLYRQQRNNQILNNRAADEPKAPSVSKAQVSLPDDVVSFRN
jgi:phospholipid-binding lipoprotein MlaA